jgi:hypothetical protein
MERMNALAVWVLVGWALIALIGALNWIATECPDGSWGC